MKTRATKLLFIHNGNETFIEIDRRILAETFLLEDCYIPNRRSLNLPALWRSVAHSEVVFCWFASWHAFFPLLFAKLRRKYSILIIVGYDIAKMPDINYGHQRGGVKKWVSRGCMYLAKQLVTSSLFSRSEANINANIPESRIKVIYQGIPDPFHALPVKPSQPMVLTVGNVDRPNLKRKGLEAFVRTAAYSPEIPFFLVGSWKDDAIEFLKSIATSNVTFTGRVSDEELVDYYRRALVYIQVSAHEGFGLSVAEAMLAGCVPIITRSGSLPEVVGNCGIYVTSPEPEEIAKAVRKVIEEKEIFSPITIRERIVTQFPLNNRKEQLIKLIQHMENTDIA